MVAAPNGPSGQGRAAPGRAAKNLATPATPAAQTPATAMGTTAAHGTSGTNGTAAVPRMVTGATSGAATMFASRAKDENWGCSRTITGPQKSWAERGTASPAASQRGTSGRKPVHDPRAGHHDAKRCQHGQEEAEAGPQCGIRHQQSDHRKAQEAESAPGAATGQGYQPDGSHERGPQDAGVRADHQHEQCQSRECGRCSGRPGQANCSGGQQQRPQDKAAVCPADCGQVGHPDCLHGGLKLFIQKAGVTRHHPGQQPPGIAADPYRGGGEPAAQRGRAPPAIPKGQPWWPGRCWRTGFLPAFGRRREAAACRLSGSADRGPRAANQHRP